MYYVSVHIPNITKIKPKAKNTCQIAGHKNLKMRWTLRIKRETGASPLNIDRGLATMKSESCPMLTELRLGIECWIRVPDIGANPSVGDGQARS